jgi:hypothetical protein
MLQDVGPRLLSFAGNRQPLVVAEYLFRNAIFDVVRVIKRPANAHLDDLSVEHPSAVDRVTGDRIGHSEVFLSPNLKGKPADAPEPSLETRTVAHETASSATFFTLKSRHRSFPRD